MEFAFHNIGPIKSAKLALRNLTVILGKNGTGKTYLVKGIRSILEHLNDIEALEDEYKHIFRTSH